jgi:sulfatase-like protein
MSPPEIVGPSATNRTEHDARASKPPASATGIRPPNILFVVLDCARAKSFAMNGGSKVARTPVIDELARRGTVFPSAIAPSNWTIPSHMSMFTGGYPAVHGRRTFRRGVAPKETTASWLSRRGYDTALFTEMVHLVGGYGLEDGYAHRVARRVGVSDEKRTTANWIASHSQALYSPWLRSLIERLPPFIVPLNFVNHPQEVAFKRDVCGTYVPEAFDRWVGERDASRPFHAFVNLVDAHEPYPIVSNGRPVGPLARWYAQTPRYYLLAVRGLQELVPWEELLNGYLWSIEQADRKLGTMLEALERAGERDRTMVIVTGDHGQSFGEAGNVFHGCGATDSITRVPLVVAPPAEFSLPSRVDRWTSLCDVTSWCKAASTGRAPFGEDGRAPLPFAMASDANSPVFCEGAPASDPNRSLRGVRLDAPWNHRLLAAYQGSEKFVMDLETDRVFRWSMTGADPDALAPEDLDERESANLRAEVFEPYLRLDAGYVEKAVPQYALSEEIDHRLRSWGYD